MKNPTPNMDYNLHVMGRAILACLFIAAAMLIHGCAYTRNAPLLNVEANGNTVPVHAAP